MSPSHVEICLSRTALATFTSVTVWRDYVVFRILLSQDSCVEGVGVHQVIKLEVRELALKDIYLAIKSYIWWICHGNDLDILQNLVNRPS